MSDNGKYQHKLQQEQNKYKQELKSMILADKGETEEARILRSIVKSQRKLLRSLNKQKQRKKIY